jgi:hypothetical protein
MSLQLYQVDLRNYLLDFKNLVEDDGCKFLCGSFLDHPFLAMPADSTSFASRHASVSMPIRPNLRSARAHSLPMPFEVQKVCIVMFFVLICRHFVAFAYGCFLIWIRPPRIFDLKKTHFSNKK